MGGMSWKFELLSHTTEAACSNARKKREYEMSEIEKESNLSCKGMRLKTKLPPPPCLYPRGSIRYVAKTLNYLLHCPPEVIMVKRPNIGATILRKSVTHFRLIKGPVFSCGYYTIVWGGKVIMNGEQLRIFDKNKEDVPTWCKQFYYDFFS